MITTTGLDIVIAKGISDGAVIEEAYWTAPHHSSYSVGTRYATQAKAIVAGIAQVQAALDRADAIVARYGGRHFVPETVYVDLRWKVRYPQGGGVDTTVTRTRYDTIVEAQEHLARLRHFHRYQEV